MHLAVAIAPRRKGSAAIRASLPTCTLGAATHDPKRSRFFALALPGTQKQATICSVPSAPCCVQPPALPGAQPHPGGPGASLGAPWPPTICSRLAQATSPGSSQGECSLGELLSGACWSTQAFPPSWTPTFFFFWPPPRDTQIIATSFLPTQQGYSMEIKSKKLILSHFSPSFHLWGLGLGSPLCSKGISAKGSFPCVFSHIPGIPVSCFFCTRPIFKNPL